MINSVQGSKLKFKKGLFVTVQLTPFDGDALNFVSFDYSI